LSNEESPVILVKEKAPKSRTAISKKMPLNKLLDEAIEYLIKERKS